MKKILIMMLGITLFLSACGGTESSGTGNSDTLKDAEVTENDETEDKEDVSVEEDITFSETVVVDNAECVIKITGIVPDDMWGYALETYMENKSGDKTYMYSVVTVSINGVQCDPFFAAEVAPGKKANEVIRFSTEELEKNGIEKYTDISLTFKVYDTNDWMADPVAYETVRLYPYGEENAVTYVREMKDSDNVIIDNEFVTVVVTGYEMDDIFGYTANLYLVNKTDKNLVFSTENVSVNGFMADPFFAKTVSAGTSAFTSMSWSEDDFAANGITEVESIEMLIRVHDYEDYTAEDYVNEMIVLNP